MRSVLIAMQMLCVISICGAQSGTRTRRMRAEYYVAAYAKHYRVPIALARAIVDRESNWQPCAVSPRGAVGLMQLMPATARLLGVTDRCNLDQNVSGGVRYLAWLIGRFHNDFRLVAAAYCAGENVIEKRGLAYRNASVVAYVKAIGASYMRETASESQSRITVEKRDVR